MDQNDPTIYRMLTAIEALHSKRCGSRHFCYIESMWHGGFFRLSIVEEGESGHFPITEDLAFGTQNEMNVLADSLNWTRLGLSRPQVAEIVASSMAWRPRQR